MMDSQTKKKIKTRLNNKLLVNNCEPKSATMLLKFDQFICIIVKYCVRHSYNNQTFLFLT